jgi:hypothetical protein
MKKFILIILTGLLILTFASFTWAFPDAVGGDFTDTAGLNAAQAAAVERLSGLGVIEGYPDGSFRPQAPVSRAELAKIICVYAGQDELKSVEAVFKDVPASAWYYGWVNRAAAGGWVKGYPDGSYLPQESVTQQEAAAMLLRALDVADAGFNWPDDYIQAAQELGMFAGFGFAGTEKASRLTICLMISNLLEPAADEEEAETETAAETEAGVEAVLADGLHIGAVKATAEREFTLWHMDGPLPLSAGARRAPKENTLIYYTVKNGEVESWTLLLDVAQGSIMPTTALKRSVVKEGPYAWAATRTGKAVDAPVDLNSAKPLVRYISYRNITVGPNSQENRNYWMNDDCLIYEAREGKITPGDRDGLETGQAVTLLINNIDEVIILLCWK